MFLDRCERAHPRTPAHQAARILLQRRPVVLDVAELAAEAGASRRGLRLGFHRRYGTTVREFHKRVRVVEWMRLLRTSDLKNEAVARELGTSSPKNFYPAVRSVTGLTPSQIRALNAEDVDRLERQLLGLNETIAS